MPSPTNPIVLRFPDGSPKRVTYHENDDYHRLDGPARVEYRADGSVLTEEWYVAGEYHREDGPAYVSYEHRPGVPSTERWYRRDVLYRSDGPSWVNYDEDGELGLEYFYRNGDAHRIDGPAVIRHGFFGATGEEFHVDGNEVEGYSELASVIAWWDDDRIEREYRDSRFAPLLDEGIPPRKITSALYEEITTLDGIRAFIGGAPAEWVRSFEAAKP